MPKNEYIITKKGFQDLPIQIGDLPDGTKINVTLEWEDPEPPNDWTPEDVAMWAETECDYFQETPTQKAANKVAELEREANAAIMEDRLNHTGKDGDGWLRGYRDALTWAMGAILFRTNEKAGYPRLGSPDK